MKLAYYPGCSGHGTSKEYESSTRAVCRALGLEFAEIEDWSCCGSTPAHAMDTVLSGALAARNFKQIALTGAAGVVPPGPSCLANLKLARHRMQDAAFKARVDALLDSPTVENAEALPETYSVLQIILEQIGPEAIRARVTRPLEGVKIATYYGCLMSRPAVLRRLRRSEGCSTACWAAATAPDPVFFCLLSCWCGLRCSPGKSGGQRHGRWTAFLWPASA